MNLLGENFPHIELKAIDSMGDEEKLNLVEMAKTKGKKIALFFYPKDFSFICPTELIALQESIDEFETKRDTLVFGISCDTTDVHFAWLSQPQDEGGIKGVEYPLLSDSKRELSEMLGILDNEDGVPFRATYLIDSSGEVFYQSINPMYIGRNIDDYLRIIDAQIIKETKGMGCKANWKSE